MGAHYYHGSPHIFGSARNAGKRVWLTDYLDDYSKIYDMSRNWMLEGNNPYNAFEHDTSRARRTKKSREYIVYQLYVLPMAVAAHCMLTYDVYADGTVKTTFDLPWVEGLPPVPEYGLIFTLPADYTDVRWYGLGPEETYADRQRGARLARYRGTVAGQMTPYLVPQECGAKCGVRQALVTDETGRGMMFTCDKEPFMFSALPYSPHVIEEAAYAYELPESHHTYVRVIGEQMGVGGDDSWGAMPHEEFMIRGRDLHFTFAFRAV